MSKKDFENMSPKEIEDYFGVTQEQIEEWDDMLVRGEIPGVSVGEVVVGRPLKFGEHLRLVSSYHLAKQQKIERMDERADSLGMKRSDYLRWLVDKDLASVDVA